MTLPEDKDKCRAVGSQVVAVVDEELCPVGRDEPLALRGGEAAFRRAEADRVLGAAGNHHIRAGRPLRAARICERECRAVAKRDAAAICADRQRPETIASRSPSAS